MSDPVSLTEAKLLLRVSHDEEDALIGVFLAAARARIEAVTGLVLDETSPAPLRLAVMYLTADAYQNRDGTATDPAAVTAWLAPYREMRL